MGKPVVHFEIGCRDLTKTTQFYCDVFEWDIQRKGPAQIINTQENKGINGHISSLGHEPHNYVTIYIEVDDINQYLEKVEASGGKKILGPVNIPNGSFAWFSDPEGTVIGLWKNL